MEARKFATTGFPDQPAPVAVHLPPAASGPPTHSGPIVRISPVPINGRSGMVASAIVPAGPEGAPALPAFSQHFPETTVTMIRAEDPAARSALIDALSLARLPERGSLHFGATNLAGLDPEAVRAWRRRNMRFVPAVDRLVPRHTVIQSIQHAAAEGEPQIAIPRAIELLGRLGMARRLAVRVEMLPGEDRKIVSLVLALCIAPRVVVLDEPTAGMPPPLALKIARTLRHYARGRRAVVICASADPAIEEMADVSIRYTAA